MLCYIVRVYIKVELKSSRTKKKGDPKKKCNSLTMDRTHGTHWTLRLAQVPFFSVSLWFVLALYTLQVNTHTHMTLHTHQKRTTRVPIIIHRTCSLRLFTCTQKKLIYFYILFRGCSSSDQVFFICPDRWENVAILRSARI